MELVACDLCESTRHTAVYEMPDLHYFPEEIFTVVECDSCGLGFVNPRPTFEEIHKYYPSEYYQEFSRNHEQHLKRYAAEASYLREFEKSGGARNLLDIGCARGDFPRFMKTRGWNVEGVEVSPAVQEIEDFKVYRQQFPEIPVNEPTYDAITAWAVLEHVHHPMAYFRKAAAVIKKGGLFVFLVTNFRSWASRYLFCEDVPRHLYFFTRETVNRYLETTGFRLEKADYRRNVYQMPPANWLSFLKAKLKGKNFSYRDMPMTRPEFLKKRGLPAGLRSSVRFAMANPLKVVDRVLWPALEAIQVLGKNYAISTFVARKVL